MLDIITVRGTGERFNNRSNMLSYVTAALDPDKFRVLGDLSYPASVGPVGAGTILGDSEDNSVTVGIANLAEMIRSTPNPVGVLGYSLGAEVVSRFAEAQCRGAHADCEVAFTACIANPSRREGDSIDPRSYGFGINGEHAAFPDRPHFEAASPNDVITSCAAGSPLRNLAVTMSSFGLAALGGWNAAMVDGVRRGRFQLTSLGWWRHPVQTWNLYADAAADITGYLTGEHTTVYIRNGYPERLAGVINQAIG